MDTMNTVYKNNKWWLFLLLIITIIQDRMFQPEIRVISQ